MWTDEQRDKAHEYNGTSTSISQIAENLDLSDEDAEDLMLECNFELCGGCGWWHECCELEFVEDRNAGFCAQCEPDLHE